MSTLKDVTNYLENLAPLDYQESYDNSGLLTGDPSWLVKGVLVTLDTTEEVIDEAVKKECNVVVSHHPIIFGGITSLTGRNHVERTVISAVKNDIAVYAIHTNLDNVLGGVNDKICEKLGLRNRRILSPRQSTLSKITTFIPKENTDEVLEAMHQAGAGQVGEYDRCSFTVNGHGRFRPSEQANPHIGKAGGKTETVNEDRVEMIFPTQRWNNVYTALLAKHPYDEVAYYLQSLSNFNQEVGSGMIGELETAMTASEFLEHLKARMQTQVIRHTNLGARKQIRNVAVCGGSGSFLIPHAKSSGADIFITGEIKYHDFFEAENQIILADIGHYESEVFTKDLLADLLRKNFNTFATNLAKAVTNPIRYY